MYGIVSYFYYKLSVQWLSQAAASVSQTVCSGYQDSSTGVCYELHYDQPLSWQDAMAVCNSTGAQLAWITVRRKRRKCLQLNEMIGLNLGEI